MCPIAKCIFSVLCLVTIRILLFEVLCMLSSLVESIIEPSVKSRTDLELI